MSRTHNAQYTERTDLTRRRQEPTSLSRLQTVLVTLELQAPQQRVRETHQ